MRKRRKNKRRSCGLCKPQKRGLDVRWAPKELARLRDFERERRRYTRWPFVRNEGPHAVMFGADARLGEAGIAS